MRDMVQNLTAMMASMNSRMNQMDGGGRKRRKVSPAAPEAEAAMQTRASLPPSQPSTSRQQPLNHVTVPAPTPAMDQPLPPPVPAPASVMTMCQDNAPPPLLDISEAVCARVAQCLQGAQMVSCSQMRTRPVMTRPLQAKGKGEPSSRVSCAPGILML